jgi:hypothetical protein
MHIKMRTNVRRKIMRASNKVYPRADNRRWSRGLLKICIKMRTKVRRNIIRALILERIIGGGLVVC